jgi:hypothetical protein
VASQNPTSNASDTDKHPQYFIDVLKSAAAHLSANRTITAQFVNMVTRNLGGSARNQPALKDILTDLRVQCHHGGGVWLARFLEAGGLKSIFDVLDALHSKGER